MIAATLFSSFLVLDANMMDSYENSFPGLLPAHPERLWISVIFRIVGLGSRT